jgi:hypothetical protein
MKKIPQEKNPMLNEQTLSTLNALKLFGMARGFSERLAHPKTADLSQRCQWGQVYYHSTSGSLATFSRGLRSLASWAGTQFAPLGRAIVGRT